MNSLVAVCMALKPLKDCRQQSLYGGIIEAFGKAFAFQFIFAILMWLSGDCLGVMSILFNMICPQLHLLVTLHVLRFPVRPDFSQSAYLSVSLQYFS